MDQQKIVIVMFDVELVCNADANVAAYLSDFVPRLSVFPANLHYIIDTLCRYPYRWDFHARKFPIVVYSYAILALAVSLLVVCHGNWSPGRHSSAVGQTPAEAARPWTHGASSSHGVPLHLPVYVIINLYCLVMPHLVCCVAQ